ncbi:MAG: SUF system NifU family Fe-S cluster assembly protein [Verrucomicrobia bacterium]|nr:SUF system NifU family Fe-S cluster assembly protein [Verrucomicrobiota bacterium]MDA1088243.1 SUF system NifU family Fe-S cluster assembly protein [Verrucomicrobiota bacterium]
MSAIDELYQEMIIEHNRNPRNFRTIDDATHTAEGFNPICGDHFHVYLTVDAEGRIEDIAFEGKGCAISKASASMMTQILKGKTETEARELFDQFHKLATGELDPDQQGKDLGKLAVFSGVSKFPARVKCAVLSWHTMSSALDHVKVISTE